MTEQAWWVVGLVAVVITGVIGFFIGRQTANSKERVDELEEALSREKAALTDYRDKVDAHFDRTAGLFVSMAGSYKDLFEHLSSGYQDLAPGASRELFKDRVSALLLESRDPAVAPAGTIVADVAAEPVFGAPASVSPAPEAKTGEPEASSANAAEVAPAATEAPGVSLAKSESVTPEAPAELDAGVAEAARPAEDEAARPQAAETEPVAATEEGKKSSP